MTELTILLHPDPRLKTVCTQVTNIDDSIKKLCLDMIDTMYKYSGVGLAAPQVGILKRVVVMDCSDDGEKNPTILINPEVIETSKEDSVFEEGCLSIPGFNEAIARPDKIELIWQDINGKEHADSPEGLLTVCIQHEIDHLDGKLMVDYISALKRDRVRSKLLKEYS